MKSVLPLVILVVFSIFFSGCLGAQKPTEPSAQSGTRPLVTEKQGTTTKTGSISEINGAFFIQEAGATPELIESYAVDLSQYVGQTVTVSGQFSGDTLFVGTIE